MAASMTVEIDEETLKGLIIDFLEQQTGQTVSLGNVSIETKSIQNYRSEWETARFRARVSINLTHNG